MLTDFRLPAEFKPPADNLLPALDDELPPLLFSVSDAAVVEVVIDMLIKFG